MVDRNLDYNSALPDNYSMNPFLSVVQDFMSPIYTVFNMDDNDTISNQNESIPHDSISNLVSSSSSVSTPQMISNSLTTNGEDLHAENLHNEINRENVKNGKSFSYDNDRKNCDEISEDLSLSSIFTKELISFYNCKGTSSESVDRILCCCSFLAPLCNTGFQSDSDSENEKIVVNQKERYDLNFDGKHAHAIDLSSMIITIPLNMTSCLCVLFEHLV